MSRWQVARRLITCLKSLGYEAVYIPRTLRGSRQQRIANALNLFLLLRDADIVTYIDGYIAVAAWRKQQKEEG